MEIHEFTHGRASPILNSMETGRPRLDDASFPSVLAGAKAGEQWAAEVLFVDLQPRLLRFLRSAEPRVADDLAGEVWLAMAHGIGSFEGGLAGFRAWVFTIARRRLADHRRTAVRRATEPVSDEWFADRAAAPADDPSERALARMTAQESIDLVVSLLPADQAEVLLLRIVGDLDVAHVAEVLDRTPNWVRVTQHRALRRLAQHFPPRTVGAVMHGDAGTI